MTAIGPAWILSKKSRTLKTSSAGAGRLGQSGITSTKLRSDFVQSESRETGAVPGGAQRRHRDRLRWHSAANDRAVEENRVLLARSLCQPGTDHGSQPQRQRVPRASGQEDDRDKIVSSRITSL